MIVKGIRKYRAKAYSSAKILGDVQAVITGTIVQRTAQRIAGKQTRKAMNKVLPKVAR